MADDQTPWTEAPYVLCEDCDRETIAAVGKVLAVGSKVDCAHCGATLQVVELETVQRTRCAVVQSAEEAVASLLGVEAEALR